MPDSPHRRCDRCQGEAGALAGSVCLGPAALPCSAMIAPMAGWAQEPSGSRCGEGGGWLAALGCSTGQGPLLSRSPGGTCDSSAAGLIPAASGSSSSASSYPPYSSCSSYPSSETSASGPSPGENHSPAAPSVTLAARSSRAGADDGSFSPGRRKNQPAGGATPGQESCSLADQASCSWAGWPACSSADQVYCSSADWPACSSADQVYCSSAGWPACSSADQVYCSSAGWPACSSAASPGSSASPRASACASRHAADLVTLSRPGGTDQGGTGPPGPVWPGAPAGGVCPEA